MEVEQQYPDNIKLTSTMETDTQENLTEDEQYNFNKTIEVENSSLKALSSENSENITNEIATENGKKKVKEEKPPSKIVVRRLPPTMSKEQFVEQVSPLPEVDYMCFVQGNINDNVNPFSRVYLSFVNQEDLFSFSNTFDNYVFLDAKGQEYPAVVEFNMVQRFPKQRNKKKDPLMGTIESDPAWISFKENLLAEALENSKTQSGKATKQHYFETEISTTEEVNTTPLLEYIKVRRAEKARVREERKEEKKRKELERKLKQKTKEKKGEAEEEESPKDVKIHQKHSEKNEKEFEKNVKSEEKTSKDRYDKNDNVKHKVNFNKKILILKSDSDGTVKIHDKTSGDSSRFDKNSTVELDTKSENVNTSNSNVGKPLNEDEAIKVKEAEQQTIFLRKLLGLLPADGNNTSNEVSVKSSDQTDSTSIDDSFSTSKIPQDLSKLDPPEEVISAFKDYINVSNKRDIFWSKHNINPALPSASFKTSGKVEGEACIEQRSLSAPRDSRQAPEGKLGKQEASSTPNVSLLQNKPSPQVVHASRLLRNQTVQVYDPAREEVLISKDKERKDLKDKERGTKKKDEKDKVKEPRVREFKSRGGKSYQEERLKLAERREEKKRELLNTGEKKSEQVEPSEMNEPNLADSTKSSEDKPVKIEKKRYERKGKYDNEEWKEEKKRLRNEKANSKREGRKEEYTRRHHEKRNSDLDLRRKGKNYKVSDSLKADKRKSRDQFEQENKILDKNKEEDDSKRKSRSFDDLKLITSEDFKQEGSSEKNSSMEKKRSNSLENLKPVNVDNSRIIEIENLIVSKKGKVQSRDSSKQTENSNFRSRKDRSKNSEGKSLSSKTKEKCDEKGEDRDEEGGNNRNPEGGGEQEKKEGGKTSSRPDKRIRNKDRPSIEIYRPGMGKFSKQRLEKEKALGSSTEVESPSHSPSPTPKSKLIT